MIRNLLEIHHQIIYKENNEGGYNLLVLDKLHLHPTVINTFGENIIFYFRVLFTDQGVWISLGRRFLD